MSRRPAQHSAEPPHAEEQLLLGSVVRAHTVPGYVAATDLLTRTSVRWNFAADVSVRKQGIDPATGRRYLEELAFEVKNTQSPKRLADRARQLVGRGVRRVFAIWVAERDDQVVAGPIKEWSAKHDDWIELGADELITDPCFIRPLPVRALLDGAAADNALAEALMMQGNAKLRDAQDQVFSEGRREGFDKGRREGYDNGFDKGRREGMLEAERALRKAVVTLCEVLGIDIDAARAAYLGTLDRGALEEIHERLRTQRRW